MSEQNPSTTSTTAQFISGSGPAAKLVNAFLRAEDIRDPKNPEKVKQIPDQMMYNYTKAKLRAGEKPWSRRSSTRTTRSRSSGRTSSGGSSSTSGSSGARRRSTSRS
jgi:uncharacterized membrane protein YgcG